MLHHMLLAGTTEYYIGFTHNENLEALGTLEEIFYR